MVSPKVLFHYGRCIGSGRATTILTVGASGAGLNTGSYDSSGFIFVSIFVLLMFE